ncbi:unnamed protein product [Acanthosepion pharaonis]|uniref:Uncharacterized protein n=1 Tax=Acanthosepion pharaonis TaxID=158019 RepID=A0A812CP59_ACAPH|nr:unnamed protein product [Sepia pharaonis]
MSFFLFIFGIYSHDRKLICFPSLPAPPATAAVVVVVVATTVVIYTSSSRSRRRRSHSAFVLIITSGPATDQPPPSSSSSPADPRLTSLRLPSAFVLIITSGPVTDEPPPSSSSPPADPRLTSLRLRPQTRSLPDPETTFTSSPTPLRILVRNIVEQPRLARLGLVCRSEVLLEDVGAFGGDLVHPGLHHAPQHLLVDLSGDSRTLLKEERRDDVPLAGDDAKDHDGGGKLCMLHDGNLLDVFADAPVVRPVTRLVLDEILFIREESQPPSGPVLELVQQSRRLDLLRLIGGIRDEHAVRIALGGVTNVLLVRSADRRLVTAHVSGDLGVALASNIVDCLLDSGDELVCPNDRRTNVVGLSFGSKLVLVLTRLSLPPNVHDHGPLEPKPGHHFRRLLPDAKRSYYFCSVLIFHPEKG